MSVFMEIGPPADKEMGMGGSAASLPTRWWWLWLERSELQTTG
jgi:hypothetical protein